MTRYRRTRVDLCSIIVREPTTLDRERAREGRECAREGRGARVLTHPGHHRPVHLREAPAQVARIFAQRNSGDRDGARGAVGAPRERGGSAAAVRRRAAARTGLATDRAGELARLRAFARMRRSAARGGRGQARGTAGAGRDRDKRLVKRHRERRGRAVVRGGARRCVAAYGGAGAHVPAGPSANP